MNRCFKVIYSKVKNSYVVVSEIAKNHTKGKGSTKSVLAGAICTALLLSGASAYAAQAANTPGEGPGVAIGTETSANYAASTAVGNNSKVEGNNSLAVGTKDYVKGDQSATVGYDNAAVAVNASAIGSSNVTSANNSSALGYANKIGNTNATAVGSSNVVVGIQSTAVGYNNRVGGTNNFVAGHTSGVGSKSSNAIVIGRGSVVGITNINGTTTVDPTRKEVIQTFIGDVDASEAVAIGNATKVMAKKAVAFGSGASVSDAGESGVALGSSSNVTAAKGTALGNGARVLAADGVAIGSSSYANIEAGKKGYDFITNKETTKTGNTWISNKGAVAVGGAGATRQITGVAAGSGDTDAVNVAQIKDLAKQFSADTTTYFHTNATGAGVDPVNNNKGAGSATAGAGGKNSLAAGISSYTGKDAEESLALGFYNNVKGKNSLVVGNRSTADGENAISMGFASAAGGKSSIAIGDHANTKYEDSIVMGHSTRGFTQGVSIGGSADTSGLGSVSVGYNARVANDWSIGYTGLAIGKNAYVLNGMGEQEYQFSFNKNNWIKDPNNTGWRAKYIPKDQEAADKMAAGLAIGANAYARTGSIDIGSRTMTGMNMGGETITDHYANIMDMTTLGTNTYNKGFMATMVGAYSISTGNFDNSGGFNNTLYGSQNMGSTILGSLNQNKSKGYAGTSGVANSIVGIANTTENANGALIYGAGNKITNSIKSIYGVSATSGYDTPDDMLNALADSVKKSEGGATLAIGGGNTADYTQASQMIGVNNTLTGTKSAVSKYNMVDGYKNTATNVNHVSLIGSENTVSDTNTLLLFGDNRTAAKADKSVILGSADKTMTTDKKNVVIIGNNANVLADGGVALGFDSVAVEKNASNGYDPLTGAASTQADLVWNPTLNDVSIGKAGESTRRITNLAAGILDTDAVNVAQLKKVAEVAQANVDTDIHVKAGDYAVGAVKDSSGKDAQGVTLDLVDKDGKDAGKVVIADVAKASDVGDLNYVAGDKGTKGNVVTNGDTVTEAIGKLDAAIDKATTEAGKHSTVESKDKNITVENTAADGEAANYQVSLNKDIDVNSVKAGDVTINKDNKGTVNGLTNTTWDPNNIVSGQAATEDQLKQVADAANNAASEAGKHSIVSAGNDNVTVNNIAKDGEAANYQVTLNKDITVDSVTAKTITSDSANIGGVEINNGGNGKIENVNDGIVAEGSKDVVNGGQLYETNQLIKQQGDTIYNINNRVSDLDNRMNKVGAGAAALAALHPLDFEADDKFNVAVGYGNYKDANAMAIGAFYRPDEKTMFSVGGSMGNGENMINVGVSLKFGKASPYTGYSKSELTNIIVSQKEQLDTQSTTINTLEEKVMKQDAENAVLKTQIEKQQAQIAEIMAKLATLK